MRVFIDLDGTIVKTLHPSWRPYRDGVPGYDVSRILEGLPMFDGAESFISSRQSKGDSVVVVSDSHYKYVKPICDKFGVEYIALADKPNTEKLLAYGEIDADNTVFIGDTRLDIELGRRLGVPTIWLKQYGDVPAALQSQMSASDCVGDDFGSIKLGPTFCAHTFKEVDAILDNMKQSLYVLEAKFNADTVSDRAILYMNAPAKKYRICCLGRQQEGMGDSYAIAHQYQLLSSPNRSIAFLQTLADGLSLYLKSLCGNWHYITYLTDKSSTIPRDKLKAVFDLIDTNIPKVRLLEWKSDIDGSLRNRPMYGDRRQFLAAYLHLSVGNGVELHGKNIVVIDDQLTTGATAWHVIDLLQAAGAGTVLFIAMFQMTLNVKTSYICPKCGKMMSIKIRKSDGKQFLSCTPPQYRGDGCGFAMNIS